MKRYAAYDGPAVYADDACRRSLQGRITCATGFSSTVGRNARGGLGVCPRMRRLDEMLDLLVPLMLTVVLMYCLIY